MRITDDPDLFPDPDIINAAVQQMHINCFDTQCIRNIPIVIQNILFCFRQNFRSGLLAAELLDPVNIPILGNRVRNPDHRIACDCLNRNTAADILGPACCGFTDLQTVLTGCDHCGKNIRAFKLVLDIDQVLGKLDCLPGHLIKLLDIVDIHD